MNLKNIILVASFICCNFAFAQNSDKSRTKEICPQLMELIKDPAFISKAASENGMTSMRFYSLETPTQKEMIIRYGEKHKICENKE